MGGLIDVAKSIANPKQLGLNEDLVKELGMKDEDVTHAKLRAEKDGESAHRAVHFLAAYVEDDTDLIGKGEVYWWSIPMLVDKANKVRWNPLMGLPQGAVPASVGSHEWYPAISLANPPLLALIPPDDEIVACKIHLGVFDDDWEPAKLAQAMTKGLTVLSEMKLPAIDVNSFVKPIRTAIFDSLKAKRDDLMLEREIEFMRTEGRGYGAGSIGSTLTKFVRVYWIVRDLERTETLGPWSLIKGQEERILPPGGFQAGGLLSVLAKGGNVQLDPGTLLEVDHPFTNVAVTLEQVKAYPQGFKISADKAAEVIAFYTPPG